MPEGDWTIRPLREVVTLHEPEVAVHDPDDEIATVGIRWYGMGLFAKPAKRSDIKSDSYFVLKPGALIYSRLFAWKQSFAVVTDEFAEVIASDEFPQFDVDPELATAEYLALYCASPIFAQKALEASDGATAVSRNRLKVPDFLGLPAVLPPLDAQERIVETVAAVDAALVATEREASALAALLLMRREALTNDPGQSEAKAGDAFEICLGRQRSPDRATGPSMTKYLRSANVGYDELRLGDVMEMDFNDKERKRLQLEVGDVLVSEGSAGADAVGMPAAWNGELDGTVCFQNTLLRYRARSGVTTTQFVRHWCLWAYESGAFRNVCPPGVNILHIGSTRAKEMRMRLPSIEDQTAIVEELEPLTAAVASLKSEAKRLRNVKASLLDALLTQTIEVLVAPDTESD